jgi:uncharacterized protein
VVSAYVVDATVSHRRTRPTDYAFQHRTTSWLVDAASPQAAIPTWMRPLVAIRDQDHLQPGAAPLLAKVRETISEHGLDWQAARVQVLTNARTAGHVFNPLTTYFCFDGSGRLEGILAEVHNTYGERHCYPLSAAALPAGARADGTEPQTQPLAVRTAVTKTFYVSPFFAVEGRYDIKARLTGETVAVSISLTQGERRVFTGAVHGTLRPATRSTVVRAWARDPFASQRVSALIRWHGIRLWLRRLPIIPRTPARRTSTKQKGLA